MKKIIAIVAVIVSTVAVAGCTQTDCVAAADEAHAIFLDEVAANPTKYSREEIRNERLTHALARRACLAFASANPVIK